MRRALLLWGAVAALAGCSEITQIVVVVDSDMQVPDEIDEVRIEVEGMASGSQTATGQLEGPGAQPLPRFVALVHRGGPLGPIQVRAVGLRGGTVVVTRSAEVSFLPGRTVALYLDLLGECVGVDCADGESCARGGCRDELIAPSELVDWTGPDHDAGAPPDADVMPVDGCVPMSEVCNGSDDDCDGMSDEEFDLTTDVSNCGACDNTCTAGANATASCASSACGSTCDAGFGDCDADATNGCEVALTSLTHCGGCGVACDLTNASETCATGSCALDTCDAGFDDCNSDPADGCETSLAAAATCGACGVMCSGSTPVCAPDGGGGFSCVSGCPSGLELCMGSCVDIATDPLHCGACGTMCATPTRSSATCAASTCGFSCDMGFDDCDMMASTGCETPLDTLTDCAACGTSCSHTAATSSCATGTCTLSSCDAGFDSCDMMTSTGCESSLADAATCGSCGVACSGGTPVCAPDGGGGFTCISGCGPGQTLCMGSCVDTTVDPLHCGACGTVCPTPMSSSATCAASTCGFTCDAGFDDCDMMVSTGCEQALNTLTHCAGCGVGCSFPDSMASCATGACTFVGCDAGFGNCDMMTSTGCEESLDTLTHCAACGVACSLMNATESCATGSCSVVMCDADFGNCDSMMSTGCETDITSSALHCGGCGAPCGAMETCTAGVCVSPTDVLQVSSGRFHTCGVQASGDVVCWGRNNRAQLGDGSTMDRSTPVTVGSISDATQVSGGGEHTCARRSTGEVACWGRSNHSQIGDGGSMQRDSATAVSGLTDALQVSAGRDHSCAVRTGGTVVCWGRNDEGQLGDNSTMTRSTHVTVMGLTDAIQVGAGRKHTCAVRMGGTVVCWGRNDDGQLGDSSTTNSFTPVTVSGLVDAVQVAAGDDHSCAVRMTGAVVCWGRGGDGQLGDGAGGGSSSPVTVSGLSDAFSVSTGNDQSCARRTGGGVRCWGDMQSPSLGEGTTQSDTPVDVSSLADALDVCAGDRHACSAQASGGVSCWGSNFFRQLGDGTMTGRSTPVSVSGLP